MRLGECEIYGPSELLGEEFRQGEAERLGDPRDVHQGDIPQTTFNATDVGPMDARFLGECFLRPATLIAQHAHTSPELDQDGMATCRHGRMVRR